MEDEYFNFLEKKLDKKSRQRKAKIKPKMKVSGAGVKQLQKIINKKTD